MKFFIVFVIIFTGFSIIVTESSFAEKCTPIELEYSIVGGNVTELCKSDTNIQVNAKIHASDKGKLVIEIPKKVVYSLSGLNCEQGELVVLMNGYEILPDNATSDKNHNIITVNFQEGNHTIAFVGLTIIPDPGPSDYCGIVMGLDSLYLPPKFQEKNGVTLKHIHCNENLKVIARYDDSAACVKYDTRTKLIERSWGKNSLYQLDDKTIIENVKDLDEVKEFLAKYPNADYSVIRDSWSAYFSVSGALEEPHDNQSRTKRILIEIDPFGRPLGIGIECGGPVTLSAQSNVIELLKTPNWCFPDGNEIEPEPARITEDEMNLRDATQKLNEIYIPNSSLGPFNIQDVIVGYGIADGVLVVDVLTEYYESDHLDLIKQKIRDIVGPHVTIEFSPSGAIVPTNG